MNKSLMIAVLMVALAVATPADNSRRGQQGRGGNGRQQAPQEQMEGADQEDGSSMNNKILECRSILQQAGMLEGNGAGQPTEGQGENETEGSKGEGMEDPMSSGNSRRNSRRH